MIAAQPSLQRIARGASAQLGIFAVEQQQPRAAVLDGHATEYREAGVPFVVKRGAWSGFVPEILERTKNCPILLFVDPFGLKGATFRDLRPLLNRTPPVDVVVRLHDASVVRNRDLHPEMISNALGTDRWTDGWTRGLLDPVEWVRSCYAESISGEMGEPARTIAYGVRPRYEHRPKFSMIFSSRHPDALELWSQELGRYELELTKKAAQTSKGQGTFLDR